MQNLMKTLNLNFIPDSGHDQFQMNKITKNKNKNKLKY